MALVNAKRLVEGAGTPESVWQAWTGLARVSLPPVSAWLPASARLVVVAPHPDDELLACGGLIHEHSARGGEILIVAVTDGEASHAGSPGWSPTQLAALRRAESTEGLRRLGLRSAGVVRLGLPDGQIAQHTDALGRTLETLFWPTDVVLSTWRLDGHPDHDATGRAAAWACAQAGCRLVEAPVWMWHWSAPGDARVPWHRMLGVPLAPRALALKKTALAAHVTQLSRRDPCNGPVLGPAILARADRMIEYLFV